MDKILYGGENTSVKIDYSLSLVKVDYEISRVADIIWPRSKIVIIGLGDYPAKLLEKKAIDK